MEMSILWSVPIQRGTMSQHLIHAWRQVTAHDDLFQVCTETASWLTQQGIGSICGNLQMDHAVVEHWGSRYTRSLDQAADARLGRFVFITAIDAQRINSGHPGSKSGAVVVHDPRAGCAQLQVPGQPFGRPYIAQFDIGDYILFPAWQKYSIVPVDDGHEMSVLRARLTGERPNDAFTDA